MKTLYQLLTFVIIISIGAAAHTHFLNPYEVIALILVMTGIAITYSEVTKYRQKYHKYQFTRTIPLLFPLFLFASIAGILLYRKTNMNIDIVLIPIILMHLLGIYAGYWVKDVVYSYGSRYRTSLKLVKGTKASKTVLSQLLIVDLLILLFWILPL
jgi:hypothetical protein